ncbi:MAG TPA: hypothetical protein VM012_11555, partial [Flavitalea sp.]|nr:hypothetical protein [Flavitalea sp.]
YQYFSSTNYSIDSLTITVEYLFIIIYCLFYLFEEITDPNNSIIYSSFKFWIVIGIFLYSTGTFFFFMQSDKMSDAEWEQWSPINHVFTLIKNLFFTIAIFMRKNNSHDTIQQKTEGNYMRDY